MQTLVCTTPGSFSYQEAAEPLLQNGHSILRIRRVGICGTDLHAFKGVQPYFHYPRILGHELSATIEETEPDSGFSKGEAVTVIPYFHCNTCIACVNGKPNCCVQLSVCGVHIDGGMTELFQVPNYALVKSEGLGLDELALVEPFSIGAHGVRRSAVQKGEHVLVVGAGPIGLGVLEMARIAGAQVTAMDVNDDRLLFCRDRLHIANTINSATHDAVQQLRELTSGDMPTVVIDATGSLAAITQSFAYLAHGARYVLVGLQREEICFSHPEFHKREATLMSSRNATRSDFEWVIRHMRSGDINPATYITHRLPFGSVKEKFSSLYNRDNMVVKAIVDMD